MKQQVSPTLHLLVIHLPMLKKTLERLAKERNRKRMKLKNFEITLITLINTLMVDALASLLKN
jgi:hypothetical protein